MLLDARPEGGFTTVEHSTSAMLEGYVARQLSWHMRGALGENEAPPEAWLTHEDEAVLQAVAVAVGCDALLVMADSAEAAGEYLNAARYVRVAGKLGDQGRLTMEVWNDLLYRYCQLGATPRRHPTRNLNCKLSPRRNHHPLAGRWT